jgi:hypothetical protein
MNRRGRLIVRGIIPTLLGGILGLIVVIIYVSIVGVRRRKPPKSNEEETN